MVLGRRLSGMSKPSRFMRLSAKAKRRLQAPGFYSGRHIKRLAKLRSRRALHRGLDARDSAGFMPRNMKARVTKWPEL